MDNNEVIETLRINIDINTNDKPSKKIDEITKSLDKLNDAQETFNGSITEQYPAIVAEIGTNIDTLTDTLAEVAETYQKVEEALAKLTNIGQKRLGSGINWENFNYQAFLQKVAGWFQYKYNMDTPRLGYSDTNWSKFDPRAYAEYMNTLEGLFKVMSKVDIPKLTYSGGWSYFDEEAAAKRRAGNGRNIDGVTSSFEKFTNSVRGLSSETKEKLASMFTDAKESMGGLKETFLTFITGSPMVAKALTTISEGMKKISKMAITIGKAILRVTIYRAIRALLKDIGASINESMKNLAIISKDFNNTMSQIQSSKEQLKAALGSVIAPVVEILEPTIIHAFDMLANLLTQFAQVFAVLNGQTAFIKAKKSVEDYAQSVRKAMNVSFDEINKFGDANPSKNLEEVDIGELTLTQQALIRIADAFNNIKSALAEIFGPLLSSFKPVLGIILDAVSYIMSALSIYLDIFKVVAIPLMKVAATVLETIFNIVRGITSSISAIAAGIANVVHWVSNALVSVENLITSIIDGIANIISGAFTKMAEGLNNLGGKIREFFTDNAVVKFFGSVSSKIGDFFSNISPFATGGFVGNADLFYANENGVPEMVGRIGNRAAVANNDQIVESIKQGVIEAMTQSGQGNIVIQLVDESGQVKGEKMIESLQRRNRREGKLVVPLYN